MPIHQGNHGAGSDRSGNPGAGDKAPAPPLLCSRTGCTKLAVLYPVLLLRAPYEYRYSTPTPATLALPICSDCASTCTLADFLSDAGWLQICQGFDAAGRVAPERDRTSLSWVKIADCPPFLRGDR